MNKTILNLSAALLAATVALPALAEGSPVGVWRTFDDRDGLPASLVQIDEKNGVLEGRVVKLLPRPGHDVDAKCVKCDGEDKGKPIAGMKILWDMRRDGDGYAGGMIFDPDSGSVYRCKLQVVDGKLDVRGFLGLALFGRTQTWVREK